MTAQFSDWLHYQGQRHPLFDNPLESYFDDEHPRPDFKAPATACWRGYVAEWEIEDDTLYLVGLDGWVGGDHDTYARNARPVGLDDLFPWFPWASDRVKATWFTGVLRIPQGELLEYVHMGYGSTFEEDLLLTIEAGNLVHTEIRDGREYLKQRQKEIAAEFAASETWLYKVHIRTWVVLSRFLPWQLLPIRVSRSIAVAVFVLILPFLIPYVIYKRGWNPKKWGLLWRPRRLVRKPDTPY